MHPIAMAMKVRWLHRKTVCVIREKEVIFVSSDKNAKENDPTE